MPTDPATVFRIARTALSVGRKIKRLIGGKKPRPFSGTIDLGAGTVDICTHNPKYCRKHPKHAARYNAALTAYLQGTGGDPGFKRDSYLLSQIDQLRDEYMRLRPLTQTEAAAWGQQTPASKSLAAYLGGATRSPTRRKRRGGKKKARRASRGARRPSRKGSRRRLVKGSAAAKAWGRKMRRLRRR